MLNLFKPHKILPKDPDFEKLRTNFAWLPAKTVQDTIENSAQWYQAENRQPMRRHVKSWFPAANVNHIPDTVSYDTIFSDTPAADDGILGLAGCTMLQLFSMPNLVSLFMVFPLMLRPVFLMLLRTLSITGSSCFFLIRFYW